MNIAEYLTDGAAALSVALANPDLAPADRAEMAEALRKLLADPVAVAAALERAPAE